MDISERIIRTVAYFDLFDYPLTQAEIWRWLYGAGAISFSRAEAALRPLVASGALKEEGGLVCAGDREGLAAIREERFRHSARKWKRARRWARAFAAVPGVELVAVGNTLAYHNAKDGSDIDFLVVAAPGTIWRSRLICAAMAAAFNLRPRPGDNRDKLCLSFFVTSGDGGLAGLDDSVYLHYWRRQLAPLAGSGEAYAAFRAENGGLAERGAVGRSAFWSWLFRPLGRLPGDWLKARQQRRFPAALREAERRGDGSVIISDLMLKFHVSDRRREIGERWEARSRQLLEAARNGRMADADTL